jgi:DNA-directed RNA polymerase subunit M/transcription elongation factor TFIIS
MSVLPDNVADAQCANPSPREMTRAMLKMRVLNARGAKKISDKQAEQIARHLELGCTKFALRDCKKTGAEAVITMGDNNHCTILYTNSAARIADLLCDSRGELINAILSQSIHASKVAFQSIETLCPHILEEERSTFRMRTQQKIVYHESTLYRCKKCGQNRTLHDEFQARGSDEAPTLAIRCLNCGHCWAQNA